MTTVEALGRPDDRFRGLPDFPYPPHYVEDAAYTFRFPREFLLRFVEHLDLRNITLVVQDWGGTLDLTLPVDLGFRSRLERAFVMNTVLPVGKPLGSHYDE